MRKILCKLAQTKAWFIAFVCSQFLPFRRIAAEKATAFLKETTRLNKQHSNNLATYGKYYKNTLGHDATELRLKWLEFKAAFLIEMFRLSNGA